MRRWPFYTGNVVLVLLAAFVAWCGGASLTGFQFFLCFVCVVAGSVLSAVPFLQEHQAGIELQKLKAQQLGDDQYTDLQQSLVLTQELKASFVLQAQKHNQQLQALDQLLHQSLQGFGPLNHKLEGLEKTLEADQLMHEQDRVRLENNLGNIEHKLQALCENNEHSQERLKEQEGLLQQFAVQIALLKPMQQQLGALQQHLAQGGGGLNPSEGLKNLENQMVARLQAALRDLEMQLLGRLSEGVHMAVRAALGATESDPSLASSAQTGPASRWKSPSQHSDWLPDILGHMVSEAASESIAKMVENDAGSEPATEATEEAPAVQALGQEPQPYQSWATPTQDTASAPHTAPAATGVTATDASDPFAGLDLADFTPDTRYTPAATACETSSQEDTEALAAAPQIPVDQLVEERLQASHNLAISWENLPGSAETPFETIEDLAALPPQADVQEDWELGFAPSMPWAEAPLTPLADAAASPVAALPTAQPAQQASVTPEAHPLAQAPEVLVQADPAEAHAAATTHENSTSHTALHAAQETQKDTQEDTQAEEESAKILDDAPFHAATHVAQEDEDALAHLSYQQAHGTCIVVRAMLGIGKKPFLRGQGPGLSWNKGAPMEFVEAGQWRWTAPDSSQPIICRVYKNDECPADGEALCLQPGEQLEISPSFRW
jgi:hypothetical protein